MVRISANKSSLRWKLISLKGDSSRKLRSGRSCGQPHREEKRPWNWDRCYRQRGL